MSESLYAVGIDSSAAAQYFDTFSRSQFLEPERALLLAILKDAIDIYFKYHGARGRIAKAHFREAEQWLMGSGDHWIFSFESVCELLGIDPGYIRRGLRQSMGQTREAGRTRPRLRRRAAA